MWKRTLQSAAMLPELSFTEFCSLVSLIFRCMAAENAVVTIHVP